MSKSITAYITREITRVRLVQVEVDEEMHTGHMEAHVLQLIKDGTIKLPVDVSHDHVRVTGFVDRKDEKVEQFDIRGLDIQPDKVSGIDLHFSFNDKDKAVVEKIFKENVD